jgi:hypothetical protein
MYHALKAHIFDDARLYVYYDFHDDFPISATVLRKALHFLESSQSLFKSGNIFSLQVFSRKRQALCKSAQYFKKGRGFSRKRRYLESTRSSKKQQGF